MRTIKPLTLSVLNAPFQHNGKVRLVLAVAAMTSFDGTKIDQEQSLWKILSAAPGSSGALDELKPKVCGEALLSGYAYAPGSKPAAVVAARLSVGTIRKDVWAVGDRFWKGTGPTDPVPFDRMPLSYDRAFGGSNYAPNPAGKGFSAIKTESGELVHPLPNIEIAKQLITSPRDRPMPAGFTAIDPSWPQRMKKGGTYDKKWLDTKYPEMADDFDPTYFNVAPEDQWIEEYWQGGESFVLENVHPDKPRIEGQVPTFVARAFVTRKGAPDGWLEDVALRCDTLWFFPHLERIILIYRGGIDVADEEASDVIDVMAALERKDKPRPLDHYRAVHARRVDRAKAGIEALRDMDLLPPDVQPIQAEVLNEMTQLLEREGLVESNMRRRAQRELDAVRERLSAAGIDPDKHLPKEIPPPQKTPRLDEMPDFVDGAMRQAEHIQVEAETRRDDALARFRETCKQHGIDLDAKMAESKRAAGGPPKFNADAQLAKIKALVAQATAAGTTLPPGVAKLDNPSVIEKMRMGERGAKDMYRRAAHHQPPAQVLGETDSARVRRDVEATLAANGSLADRDLTGADLAGLDFSGRDLSGSFLEKANLAACTFRGANVERTVFTRATLRGADFHGARTMGANFGEADLTSAKLTGEINLTEAIFVRATLREADFTGAKMDRAELSEATFEKTNFAKVRANGLTVMKSDLRGIDLRGAELIACNLLEVDLSGVDFTGATLTKTAFIDTTVEGGCFRSAKMNKVRIVKVDKGSSLAKSDLRGANLEGANLRGVNLEGADLREADLTHSDFSDANLRGANLEGARAVDARFVKADLTDANVARADFMHALLGGAILRGANFEEASLFRADAAKTKGDDKTSFKGANVKQVRVVPDRSGNG